MAELSTLISLSKHQDANIAWAAQQSLQIVNDRNNGSLTPEESTTLLENLREQTQIAMQADTIENKAMIDSALVGLLAVISIATSL